MLGLFCKRYAVAEPLWLYLETDILEVLELKEEIRMPTLCETIMQRITDMLSREDVSDASHMGFGHGDDRKGDSMKDDGYYEKDREGDSLNDDHNISNENSDSDSTSDCEDVTGEDNEDESTGMESDRSSDVAWVRSMFMLEGLPSGHSSLIHGFVLAARPFSGCRAIDYAIETFQCHGAPSHNNCAHAKQPNPAHSSYHLKYRVRVESVILKAFLDPKPV